MPEPVLSVIDLVTELRTPQGVIRACDGVSFDLHPGETLGLVGESGSGKSVTALSILGLLPKGTGYVARGSITLDDIELTRASRRQLRSIRGKIVSIVFQDPMTSLNPVLTVGSQIVEALEAHQPDFDRDEARERAVSLLELVGVPNTRTRVDQYPHEFSGGMRQRVLIALAIANQPKVLIADEPTTALDVTIQAQVLDVLRVAQRETDASVILITHDLGVIAELADRVAVMYGGRIVEMGTVDDIFHQPRHPYTVGLLASLSRLDVDVDRLLPVTGNPPDGLSIPSGCAFHPRCSIRNGRERCAALVPDLVEVGPAHRSACHFHAEVTAEMKRVAERLGIPEES